MYTKEEASKIRQKFWTAFGKYISPHLSADGLEINWINYKTGIKDIYFRMNADNYTASISIQMTHQDSGIQELHFEQFKVYREFLESKLGEAWEWQLHTQDEYGKTISSISRKITEVNVFNENDWPSIISFLKPRIIALDQFWSEAKYGFDDLK